jgi:hypothetical protein
MRWLSLTALVCQRDVARNASYSNRVSGVAL